MCLCLWVQEAVDQLSHNSEESMWVKLSGCHLADSKLKKVRVWVWGCNMHRQCVGATCC